MKASVGWVMDAVGDLAPWELAAEWDNSGLQVGSRGAEVQLVLVALDAGREEIEACLREGAGLLLTHHPLLFQPLRRLDGETPLGDALVKAIQGNLAVISAHTNLDAARNGLADVLAASLGMTKLRVLSPPEQDAYLKLVVYAPERDMSRLAEILKALGAGRIGQYGGCSFVSSGTGTFTPLKGSSPAIGRQGQEEKVPEARLETRIHRRQAAMVLEALREAHPYEEPVMDVYPIQGHEEGVGFGRLGEVATDPEEFVREVKRVLGCPQVRLSGPAPRRISRVAVVPGSGGDSVRAAREAGAQVMLTGECRYHQALEAASLGLWLIEAGHRATESLAVPLLAGQVRDHARRCGCKIDVREYHAAGDIPVIR